MGWVYSILYKNQLYKNSEPQIGLKIKSNFRASPASKLSAHSPQSVLICLHKYALCFYYDFIAKQANKYSTILGGLSTLHLKNSLKEAHP